MKQVLLLCNVPSPFLIELAEAVDEMDKGWRLHIWFGTGLPAHRGKHWLHGVESKWVYCANEVVAKRSEQVITLSELLEVNQYEAIISLLPMHPGPVSMIKNAIGGKVIPFMFWHEPPIPRGKIIDAIKRVGYRLLEKRLRVTACLAIGYRAVQEWQKVFKAPFYLVPYYQNLAKEGFTSETKKRSEKIVRFVFSGQLVERNNVEEILSAIQILNERGFAERYQVTFFGDGPLRSLVSQAIEMRKENNITLDHHTPTNWEDRLAPIKTSDVLLYPGNYSGWGLTVPEALSLGKPVISTWGIESARYYIKDGLNGFLISTSANAIARAMEYFLQSPEICDQMEKDCIDTSRYGDVKTGALALARILKQMKLL